MTAELVRGQNLPLPGGRLEIAVVAGAPVLAAVITDDGQGGPGLLVRAGQSPLPGVELPRRADREQRLAVEPGALPADTRRVLVVLCRPDGGGFGAVIPPRVTVTGAGEPVALFTLTGLGPETALLAIEVYRRGGGWKLRAVGQGYAGGLPALLADHAVPEPRAAAAALLAAATSGHEGHAAERGDVEGGGSLVPDDAGLAAEPGRGAAPVPLAAGDGVGTTAGVMADGPSSGTAFGTGIDYRHPRRRAASASGTHGDPARPAAAEPGGPYGSGRTPAPGEPTASGPHGPVPAGPASTGSEQRPPRPVAGDAAGWSMDERLHNQVWGMFEDLARCVAAYRGTEDFARGRYDQELDRLLADPRTRGGAAADAARDAAELRMVALVDQARAVLDRDLAQLAAEAEVVEPALPPSLAGWDNPCWHAYQVPSQPPFAVRLGELSLPEAPELRIPLMVRTPLHRGIWVDSLEDRRAALDVAVALAARLLASFPAGAVALHALDPGGSGATALAPLRTAGALAAPPAPGTGGVGETLRRMTDRVDLLHMARGSDATDALPPGFDTADQVLLINDYPYGFDDQAVHRLDFLAEEGPAVGVHLIVVGDGAADDECMTGMTGMTGEAAFARYADPRRRMLRLTPGPSRHLADPWVGHAWTYEPSLVPPGSRVLTQVLAQVAAARPAYGP